MSRSNLHNLIAFHQQLSIQYKELLDKMAEDPNNWFIPRLTAYKKLLNNRMHQLDISIAEYGLFLA